MSKEIEQVNFPNEYKVLGADLSLKQPGFCILTIKNKKIKNVEL